MHRGLISRFAFTGGQDVERRITAKLNIDARHAQLERKLSHYPAASAIQATRRTETVRTSVHSPYSIGTSQNSRRNIHTLAAQNHLDPAMHVSDVGEMSGCNHSLFICPQGFRDKLQAHLLLRARTATSGDTKPGSANITERVRIKDDSIFEHVEVHFNYTTYDLRRNSDVITTSTPDRANVMLLAAQDGPNPGPESSPRSHFLYARVLKAYHTYVYYEGPNCPSPKLLRFEFLWVRWYDLGDEAPYSLRALHFSPVLGSSAFDFIDPSDVLRSTHILPAFAYGQRKETQPSQSPVADDGNDWFKYYVGRYVRNAL